MKIIIEKVTGEKEDIPLPDGRDYIADFSFLMQDDIVRVIIPEGIRSIGTYAFWACCNLEELECPKELISIGDSAFANCAKLQKVKIPQNTQLGQDVFSGCNNLKIEYF